MTVDRNLFLHDLAVVAILKNEAPYLKEWLDYHLLAGVDHFYLYDNDSPDNQAEVVAPYVEAGIVDYFSAPGKAMQYAVYNEAVKRFKFHCRYMAFIDGDEFIFPRTGGGGIVETVDEILSHDEHAAGLAINWQLFGSNGHETADLTRTVLERFTRRAPVDWAPNRNDDANIKLGNAHVKTIADPRRVKFVNHPHYLNYFDNFYAVNEQGKPVNDWSNYPVTADKIAVNHYYTKSREEFVKAKMLRGWACENKNPYDIKSFEDYDRNEVFDDGILRYAAERMKTFRFPDKNRTHERVLNALTANLVPTFFAPPKDFYRGKFETFLTCRAVVEHLQTKFRDEATANFFEEAALKAALKALQIGISLEDMLLFVGELPKLLKLPYPAVDDLRKAALELTEQLKTAWRLNVRWKDFVELDYLQDILRS